jgi:putative iron-dependent peroxidase
MYTPQAGIFALGTPSHAYLEFDLGDGSKQAEFAAKIAAIREPRTTTGGVNFVIGFRPELWRRLVPGNTPAGVEGFNDEVRGVEGFVMPATQHDGSENPTLLDAPEDALIAEGMPGAAGSVLLLQKWKHKVNEWEALPVEEQELVIGRTKLDSVEIENKPAYSHVARTDQDEFGNIFRRNMPYGGVADHGTMFVGFSSDQKRLSRMLESMAGLVNGTRDALTKYTVPLTGSYYFVPSVESLRGLR